MRPVVQCNESPLVSSIFRKQRAVIKLAGGFSRMSSADSLGMHELFDSAIDDSFDGIVIAGATRTIKKAGGRVHETIAEIGPRIVKRAKKATLLGLLHQSLPGSIIRPKSIVWTDDTMGHISTIHPEYTLVEEVAGDGDWTAEAIWTHRLFKRLSQFETPTALVVYNGGPYTEFELTLHAQSGLAVVLVEGSGRIADRYAKNKSFLRRYPNVLVAKKNGFSLGEALTNCFISSFAASF